MASIGRAEGLVKALRVAAVEQAPEIPLAILHVVLQLQPEVVAVRVGDLRDVRDAVALADAVVADVVDERHRHGEHRRENERRIGSAPDAADEPAAGRPPATS